MKKLLAGSLTLVLVAGVATIAILALSQPARADMCVYSEVPFIYYGGSCKPDPGTKKVGQFDYVRKYECLGYYDSAGTPCMCTYLGCVKDPYHLPPNPEPDL
jgi:hypothetical protein